MYIYIIRHGQSTNEAGVKRKDDPPLSKIGEAQSRCAGRYLRSAGITGLYTSPMRRALLTAARIGDTLGSTLEVDPDLCEVDGLGHHRGLTREEMFDIHPRSRLADSITDSGWWNCAEEELEDVAVRAKRVSERLLKLESQETDSSVVVVTHGTFASYLVRAMLGVDPQNTVQFALRNTAITLIEVEYGLLTVRFTNRIDHLPDHLVS